MKLFKNIVFTVLSVFLFTSFAKEPSELYVVEEESIDNITEISYKLDGVINQDAGMPSANNE